MSYCFVCLFRADKGTSGLALRIPLLWKELATKGEDVTLIINQSLYDKTLCNLDCDLVSRIYIIPELIDFKIISLLYVPPILFYLLTVKNTKKFHLSVGGAYFIDYLKITAKFLSKEIFIHTSIGSKNLDMIVGGDIENRYYKLHNNLMSKSDKIDCLYSPIGFPEYSHKCLQSPGSFSWKYSTETIRNMSVNSLKNTDIVFIGSLLPQKNYQLAIDAYKELSKDFNNVNQLENSKLIIVAPSIPQETKIEIEKFNKNGNGLIVIESYINVNKILQDSYLFLSLQDYDNYPSQSLIEAMIFGCTVIATNFGETKSIVKLENGNMLISKNVNELTDAIKIILNKQNVTNLANIQLILEEHTIEVYANYFKSNFLNYADC